MEFWKMNGAGNDFVMVNNYSGRYDGVEWSEIASILCERHLSIGADGFMVVEKPVNKEADFRMLFFNSDGTAGEMCGNGARCICRFGYENGLAGDVQVVETAAGLVTGYRLDQRDYRIKLNRPTKVEIGKTAWIDGRAYEYSYVELGNPGIPHVVVEIRNLRSVSKDRLRQLGLQFRHYKEFPKGANVNFFECVGDNHLYEVTYERHVEDLTYACGTGTGSVVAVLTLLGRTNGKQVLADMRGGQLVIDAVLENESITELYLTGTTNIVAKGEATDDNLYQLMRRSS